ncbi:MAG: 30S ribosomal protein S9 [Candidatus Fibromonas sp.]|nr:30S ribosomal protein S9 [Candidatus Fibromonas sp.]
MQQKIYRGTGRRKSAVASVILKEGTGKRTVNGRDFKDYFHSDVQNMVANLPFSVLGNAEKWDVIVNANGGGIAGQMGAIRLGIARALVEQNTEVKPALRHANLLTRDARVVERKKYGRKKARKHFQFSKR